MNYSEIQQRIDVLSQRWFTERPERQGRSTLSVSDFDALRQAGFPQVAVPTEHGGAFVDVAHSVRPICGILRSLAHGDSSVALVCAMHPAVLSNWLLRPQSVELYASAWQSQRSQVFSAAKEGAFFGTITSEPGSGGDIGLTRAVAHRRGTQYLLDGQKHFGSGLGMVHYMITTAVPEGETEPDWFLLDVHDAKWDGGEGMTLVAPWDGRGMTATQSHSVNFHGFPAIRHAWPGQRRALSLAAAPLISCLFGAVIVGIVDTAMSISRAQLASNRIPRRSFEQLEWVRAEIDAWLLEQALDGMLREAEKPQPSDRVSTQGKIALAELAESCLSRLGRISGGSSYSRRSPIGHLLEDVRALGFLRPPWGLAFETLLASCQWQIPSQ